MNKTNDCYEKLLTFMYQIIEEKAVNFNHLDFNFSFARTEKYFNAEDELIADGENLKEFKANYKKFDNETIKKALVKAQNEKEVKTSMGNPEFQRVRLTEHGFTKGKAILYNKETKRKNLWKYLLDRLLVPVLVSVVTAVLVAYTTTWIQSNEINSEIKLLKKEIEWIKQNK